MTVSGDTFGCHSGRESALGILWVEVRDAAKHPATSRVGPPTNNDIAQEANSTEVKRPWLIIIEGLIAKKLELSQRLIHETTDLPKGPYTDILPYPHAAGCAQL